MSDRVNHCHYNKTPTQRNPWKRYRTIFSIHYHRPAPDEKHEVSTNQFCNYLHTCVHITLTMVLYTCTCKFKCCKQYTYGYKQFTFCMSKTASVEVQKLVDSEVVSSSTMPSSIFKLLVIIFVLKYASTS